MLTHEGWNEGVCDDKNRRHCVTDRNLSDLRFRKDLQLQPADSPDRGSRRLGRESRSTRAPTSHRATVLWRTNRKVSTVIVPGMARGCDDRSRFSLSRNTRCNNGQGWSLPHRKDGTRIFHRPISIQPSVTILRRHRLDRSVYRAIGCKSGRGRSGNKEGTGLLHGLADREYDAGPRNGRAQRQLSRRLYCRALSPSEPRCFPGFTFPRRGMGVARYRVSFHGRNGRTGEGHEVYLGFDAPSRVLPNGHSTFQRLLDEGRDTFSKLSRRSIHPLWTSAHHRIRYRFLYSSNVGHYTCRKAQQAC